jgi:hypothetical protein
MIAQINNQSTRALQKFSRPSTGMGNAAAEFSSGAGREEIVSDIAARASRDHILIKHDAIWTRLGQSVEKSTAREDGKLGKSSSAA